MEHCNKCIHSEYKIGVAGGLWCKKKKALPSIARRTGKDGDKSKDCFEAVKIIKN